ncbi:TM2 domain-containing protein [Allopusillimonas soli]|uniref:TM2 domain-containing protein n=2 Tax=Allopusillimonas soli TaxID=659016 RepID=A0A853F562_9BURK|nr:NINE protein [Allopusillimonas soli]NYT35644.1 TM2 domain-containing protein [Allopusillimonas soli]TEA76733.1 TM2 domain-containing protein [Allopusillimonas soli]
MMTTTSPSYHRSKVAAAWLASLFGVIGAHWWYLGRPRAWAITAFGVLMLALSRLYPVWWDSPPFLILIIPITAGFIESLVFALKTDEWFDARYNPRSGRCNQTGWSAVFAAIFSTLVGAAVLTFGIALIVLHVYKALGWLDGLVI